MRTPDHWNKRGLLTYALLPFTAIYALAVTINQRLNVADKAPIPVLCVGNLVAGGAGKTPTAIALSRLLAAHASIAFITRGYGGSLTGPVRVDPHIHTSAEVGDEALLLAAHHPTYVARKRIDAIRIAAQDGATLAILDDGFQHLQLHKDYSLLVVDGGFGFGNRMMMPSGPLREAASTAFKRANAMLIIGRDEHDLAAKIPNELVLFAAQSETHSESLRGKKIIAFAGIGRPEKFHQALRDGGVDVVAFHPFADHQPYTAAAIQRLQQESQQAGALLVTTRKDWVRVPAELRTSLQVVDMDLVFANEEAILKSILPILDKAPTDS